MLRNGNSGLKMGVSRAAHTQKGQYAYMEVPHPRAFIYTGRSDYVTLEVECERDPVGQHAAERPLRHEPSNSLGVLLNHFSGFVVGAADIHPCLGSSHGVRINT